MRRVLLAGFVAAACAEVKSPDPKQIAVVEIFAKAGAAGAPALIISEADYRHELARTRVNREHNLRASPLPPKVKNVVLDRLVDRSLLLRDAERLGVKPSTVAVARELSRAERGLTPRELRSRLIDTFQTREDLVRLIEERLTVAELLRKAAHANIVVSREELQVAWAEIPAEEKRLPDLVHASQILVRTMEEGRDLATVLQKRNADFAELARAHSHSPEAARGGDLGWFERGAMPKIFDEVCFALKPGQISPLTPSEYGFHIFKVHALEPGRELGLAELEERLESKILHAKLQEAEDAYLVRLRAQYEIQKNERVLANIE